MFWLQQTQLRVEILAKTNFLQQNIWNITAHDEPLLFLWLKHLSGTSCSDHQISTLLFMAGNKRRCGYLIHPLSPPFLPFPQRMLTENKLGGHRVPNSTAPCQDRTVRVYSLPHRKWREIQQQPGTAGPGNMLGCCLIYFHFLFGKLSTRTVLVRAKFVNYRFPWCICLQPKKLWPHSTTSVLSSWWRPRQ